MQLNDGCDYTVMVEAIYDEIHMGHGVFIKNLFLFFNLQAMSVMLLTSLSYLPVPPIVSSRERCLIMNAWAQQGAYVQLNLALFFPPTFFPPLRLLLWRREKGSSDGLAG